MIDVQIASDLTQDGVEGVRWVLVEPGDAPADAPAPSAGPAQKASERPAGPLLRVGAGPAPSAFLKALWVAGLLLALLLTWIGLHPAPAARPAAMPAGAQARPGTAAPTPLPDAAAWPGGAPVPQAASAPLPVPPAGPASAPRPERQITAGLR